MYRYLLFDLDGTLTDPVVGIVTSVRYALEKEGFDPHKDDDLTWVIGPPLEASFLQLAGTDDLQVAKRLTDRYRERFQPIGLYENTLYPEVPVVLESLQEMGIPCFIATSKPTVFALEIARHFGIDHYFREIFGSELDGSRSGKAQVISGLIERHRLPTAECLMVGDRMHDVIGAKENSMDCLGVLYGYGNRAELENVGATYFAESFADVLKYI